MVEFDILKGKLCIFVIGVLFFIIFNLDLVIVQCKVGIVGFFLFLNVCLVSQFDEWFDQIIFELDSYNCVNLDKLAVFFVVNQIVYCFNNWFEEDMVFCEKYKVLVVICFLGVQEVVYKVVDNWGGIMLYDVINQCFVYKVIDKGVMGFICVLAGVGGYVGVLLFYGFIVEICEWFDGLILCFGLILIGGGVFVVQVMGVDYVYIGFVFIVIKEVCVEEVYKQGIVDGKVEDIVYINFFIGVYGNYLCKLIEEVGFDLDNLLESDLLVMNFGFGGNFDVKVWKDIWGFGQGIGLVKVIQSVGEYIDQLVLEYEVIKVWFCF